MTESNAWKRYRELMAERPELFLQSDMLNIISDSVAVSEFSEKSGKTIGVVYESPYSLLVVDLVEDVNGKRFAYERLVPARSGGVVGVSVYEGKFVMLKQFRHAIREYQIAFPRGFAEKNLSPEENLRKEIKEELGADLLDCKFLGKINPDSGITSNAVDIYFCNIAKPEIIFGNEGISKYILHTADELREKIKAGEITDSFTLSAFALLSAQQTLT